MRSPYTPDNPPPANPPVGVIVPSLWPVQVRLWTLHTPERDDPQRCAAKSCRQPWPCHSWAAADGQLGVAVDAHRRLVVGLATGRATCPATFTEAERAAAAIAVKQFRAQARRHRAGVTA